MDLFSGETLSYQADIVRQGMDVGATLFSLHQTDAIAPRVVNVLAGVSGEGSTRIEGHGHLPQVGLDELIFAFDEDVVVRAGDLTITDGARAVRIAQFAYDPVLRTATWTFDGPLSPNSYQIALSDTITDRAGNRLDGDFQATGRSGDGLIGRDYRRVIQILPGDLDNDGRTDLQDLQSLARSIAAMEPYLTGFDLNLDGSINAVDLTLLQDHLGESADLIQADRRLVLANLGDLNADGFMEIAVLQNGSAPTLQIHPIGGGPETVIALNASFHYEAVVPIFEDGVTTEVALVSINKTSGAIRVWIWDGHSPALNTSFSLGRGLTVTDSVAWQSDSGQDHLGVLAEIQGNGRFRLVDLNLDTGVRQLITLPKDWTAMRIEHDAAANELVLLGQFSTGGIRAFRRDEDSLSHLGSIGFGTGNVGDFALGQDAASGETRYILASTQGNAPTSVRVQTRDVGGALEGQFSVDVEGDIRALHYANTVDGEGRIVLIQSERDSLKANVHVSAIDGGSRFSPAFGAGATVDDAVIMETAEGLVIALAQRNPVTGAEQVTVRMAETHTRLQTQALVGAPIDHGWFQSQMVQGHTRFFLWHPTLGNQLYNSPGFSSTGADFAALGATVFTRSAHHFDETLWWPSETLVDANGNPISSQPPNDYGIDLSGNANLIQPMVNEAWANGTQMLAYFNNMSDAQLAAEHPEWVVRDQNGQPVSHPTKGLFLDITGPFGQIVLQRLIELADMGVGGIYLDFRHLPAGGAWDTQIEADWTALTGTPAPRIGRNEDYEAFIQFSAQRMAETIEGWKATLAEQFPALELIVSVTSVPALTRPDMNIDLAAIANPKSEFEISLAPGMSNQIFRANPALHAPDDLLRQAFGFALLRDAASAGTPHIWKAWSPTGEQDRAFIAAVTTFGCIAALDVYEEVLGGAQIVGMPSLSDYAESFAFGQRISPFLSNVTPESTVAVLWSEETRDEFFSQGDVAIWSQINLPALGAFEAFSDAGHTPTIVTDGALSSDALAGVTTLVIPDITLLGTATLTAVADFVAAGGHVISTADFGNWSTAEDYTQAVEALTAQAGSIAAPVKLLNLPDHVFAAAYRQDDADGRIVVAVTNRFDGVQTSTWQVPITGSDIAVPPPPVAAGIVAQIAASTLPAGTSNIVAYDAVSGKVLNALSTGDGWQVSLPQFDQMVVLVIESVAP